jgi:hypothetical protein
MPGFSCTRGRYQEVSDMTLRATTVLAAAFLFVAPVASHAALASYSQNFEAMTQTDPAALSNDGWVVYGNVFAAAAPHAFIYGYGTFPAPNPGAGFSAVAAGEGGALQGAQQLNIYSDYNNTDQALGRLIEADVFKEQTIGAGDLHTTWTFQYDAKLGNLVAPTTANAFIKTIDPLHGYAMTNFFKVDMSTAPGTWNTYQVSISLDSTALVGQLLQFGFSNTCTQYAGSGIFYDNITFTKTTVNGVAPSGPSVMDLRPASPNPFASSTRIDYSMPQTGAADLTVFDVTGRRIATLFHGEAAPGPHSAVWNGRMSDGRNAPAGVYRAVLQTTAGRITRNIVLSR